MQSLLAVLLASSFVSARANPDHDGPRIARQVSLPGSVLSTTPSILTILTFPGSVLPTVTLRLDSLDHWFLVRIQHFSRFYNYLWRDTNSHPYSRHAHSPTPANDCLWIWINNLGIPRPGGRNPPYGNQRRSRTVAAAIIRCICVDQPSVFWASRNRFIASSLWQLQYNYIHTRRSNCFEFHLAAHQCSTGLVHPRISCT